MVPFEPLLCPCCTPALLQTLAHSDLTRIPQQMLWLGTGALSAVVNRSPEVRSPIVTVADAIAPQDQTLTP
ncbi:hypothetical protein [Stenomitos frigidus]|uniref:Uncharacterized protein n=1 Tax=Stenomitos frigidus ULC18 TaxID=2107698 RepID=A0A2T1DSZ7_9CYAN|nr:hypothetical protein [Stenomitos frigidus]PSB23646.1 hypothetical protein C7B82_30725 [Stenomitos frigidus ULC18]